MTHVYRVTPPPGNACCAVDPTWTYGPGSRPRKTCVLQSSHDGPHDYQHWHPPGCPDPAGKASSDGTFLVPADSPQSAVERWRRYTGMADTTDIFVDLIGPLLEPEA